MAFGKAAGLLDKVRLEDGPRLHLETAAIAAGVIAFAALLGVALRSGDPLVALSPANAILLGMMVRFPHLATPAGWAGAVAGYLIADLLTGNSLLNTLLLTAANLAGVTVGYALLLRQSEADRQLKNPTSVFRLVLVLIAASAAAAICGAIANEIVRGGAPLMGAVYWFVSELVNYIAFLPVILTVPGGFGRLFVERRWTDLRQIDFRQINFRQIDYGRLATAAVLVLSVIAAITTGGLGALAFPLTALLWCGLNYSVFVTAVLTLIFSTWALVAIALGLMRGWLEIDEQHAMISIRLSVTLLALAPITVASVMAARNELRNRFEQIASRDLLSGLLSRHAFVERSEQLLAEAAHAQVPVAVLMLDIDHFKKINHTHGLGAGDRVIMTLAGVVTTTLSDADVIGRLGGEEFAALLAGATPAEATAAAEQIRHVFAATPTDLGNGIRVEATASIGIGCATQAPASIEPLLQVADEALSLAKGGGRNRIVRRDAMIQRTAPPMRGVAGTPARST